MHEASIAVSLLEMVCTQCRQEGYGKILQIQVKIGRASGILSDALSFAFDCAKEGTEAENAVLCIETVPLSGTCQSCQKTIQADPGERFLFQCSFCGSKKFSITGGTELQVVDIDVA